MQSDHFIDMIRFSYSRMRNQEANVSFQTEKSQMYIFVLKNNGGFRRITPNPESMDM